MSKKKSAMVVGCGAEQGLGAALCRKFAAEGFHVYSVGRTLSKLQQIVATLGEQGFSAEALEVDVCIEQDIMALFDYCCRDNSEFQPPELVVFNVGNNRHIDFLSLTVAEQDAFWRAGCMAGFVVAREALGSMLAQQRGTLLFTGASASLRGKAGYAHFSAAKAGLRMLSQSLAREYGPLGIHVAHIIIDGGIEGELMRRDDPQRFQQAGVDRFLTPDAIAETYWYLHCQPACAWTQEIDLRPFAEPF